MSNDSKPKEVKHIAVLEGIFFIFGLVAIILIISKVPQYNYLSYQFISSILSLVLIPFIIFGLWNYKKWSLYLATVFSIFHVVDGLVFFNIIKVIIHAIILFYLFKYKSAFE